MQAKGLLKDNNLYNVKDSSLVCFLVNKNISHILSKDIGLGTITVI